MGTGAKRDARKITDSTPRKPRKRSNNTHNNRAGICLLSWGQDRCSINESISTVQQTIRGGG